MLLWGRSGRGGRVTPDKDKQVGIFFDRNRLSEAVKKSPPSLGIGLYGGLVGEPNPAYGRNTRPVQPSRISLGRSLPPTLPGKI